MRRHLVTNDQPEAAGDPAVVAAEVRFRLSVENGASF